MFKSKKLSQQTKNEGNFQRKKKSKHRNAKIKKLKKSQKRGRKHEKAKMKMEGPHSRT